MPFRGFAIIEYTLYGLRKAIQSCIIMELAMTTQYGAHGSITRASRSCGCARCKPVWAAYHRDRRAALRVEAKALADAKAMQAELAKDMQTRGSKE